MLIIGMSHYFLDAPTAPETQWFLETLTPLATAERIDSPNFRYYVAEDTGGLCGVVSLRNGSHLYHLFVRPDMHRQKRCLR